MRYLNAPDRGNGAFFTLYNTWLSYFVSKLPVWYYIFSYCYVHFVPFYGSWKECTSCFHSVYVVQISLVKVPSYWRFAAISSSLYIFFINDSFYLTSFIKFDFNLTVRDIECPHGEYRREDINHRYNVHDSYRYKLFMVRILRQYKAAR